MPTTLPNLPVSDPPRVTLIVLAFNQQAYIGDAIASALAQDYSNLQIVLSDDGSSDGTFRVMQQAARDYAGPHDVVVNRTSANRGLVQHFYDAFRYADGAFIVGAAGDDMSMPHRVSALVSAWQETGADALFSDWEVIEADGSPAAGRPTLPLRRAQRYFPDSAIVPILGVSAAYDRRVFENIAEPDFPVWAEDFFFFLMLGFRSGRVTALDERLVLYRRHGSALTHRIGGGATLERYERTNQKFAQGAADTLSYLERSVAADSGYTPGYGTPARVDLAALRSDIAFARWQSRWIDASLVESLRESLRHLRADRARWLLPRIAGLRGLRLLKRLRRGGGG